jgi:hypothetical protein
MAYTFVEVGQLGASLGVIERRVYNRSGIAAINRSFFFDLVRSRRRIGAR